MRILHVITTINRGGAENHLLDLARGQADAGPVKRAGVADKNAVIGADIDIEALVLLPEQPEQVDIFASLGVERHAADIGRRPLEVLHQPDADTLEEIMQHGVLRLFQKRGRGPQFETSRCPPKALHAPE